MFSTDKVTEIFCLIDSFPKNLNISSKKVLNQNGEIKILLRKRSVIETVNDELKNILCHDMKTFFWPFF